MNQISIPIAISNPLIADVLFYLSRNNPEVLSGFLAVDIMMRNIALKCFSEVNLKIIQTFPLLLTKFSKLIPDIGANKIFMRIVNCLYEEAGRLDHGELLCSSVKLDQLTWNCLHYPDLIKQVQEGTEIYKKEAFDIFVKRVASEVGLVIPIEINSQKFWEDSLKNNEKLQQITQIDLHNCQMKFLPPEIGFLSNLKFIYLNSNKIKNLPYEFESLSKLILVNLNYNQLSDIPIHLASLSNLLQLRMTNNNLKSLSPESFKLFSNLENLDLSDNPLGKVPEGINTLKNLTTLQIDKAQLEEIPDNLSDLKKLKTLSLGSNQLKKINPQLIASLSNLESLFLRKNPLEKDTLVILERMNRPFILEIEIDGKETFSGFES